MPTSTSVSELALPRAEPLGAAAPYWTLRLGAALCFIGHGAFGFITKAAWVPYFDVVGIPEPWAYQLMPLVGAVDVLAGMAVLFGPTRLPLCYMVAWATWTGLLRPLAGESGFEALERAGNYGVPLALLLSVGIPRSWREALTDLPPRALTAGAAPLVFRTLQWTTVLLLLGHGSLAAAGKPLIVEHYGAIGLPGVTPFAGWLEIALAGLVAWRPGGATLLFVALWKFATEALFLAAGAPIWEFVERAGSFAAPLAAAFLAYGAPSTRAIAKPS